MEKSVQITAIIMGSIIFLAIFGGLVFYNLMPDQFKGTTVNVEGVSTIKATPDLVKVYFNMETSADTSSEATSKNAEQVDDMTTALIKLGLERKDIQTQNFNVYPWQEWVNNRYVDKGYKATHQIIIELSSSQFSMVGDVIDAGVESEALISYINFELSQEKQNEYKAEAFKQAAEDARTKAESIAEGLGKDVGKVVSVTTQDWSYRPWALYESAGLDMVTEAGSAKQATTSISPSSQEVTGQVTVVYALD